jgi:Cof subfamily protein (haloacid dehalogenase superfamily)
MYRLIATDIDDTILAPDGSLPESNRLALERLHKRGVVVVFSSGRATISIRSVAARIVPPDDDEYLIAYNGARVTTARTDRVMYQRPLTPDSIKLVMGYARSEGLLVQGYRGDDFLVERDDPRSAQYAHETDMKYEKVPDLVAALPEGSPKLLIIDDPATAPKHQEQLTALARGRFTAIPSKPHYIEILDPGVSKGDALMRLAEHLGIPIAETIAVGDSLNDREMLQAAGLGVAVANARDELKAIADIVLERTAAEGALQEVEERFWRF